MIISEERKRLLEEIKKALDLSIQVASARQRLEGLSAQNFRAKPTPPVKQQIPQPQYPAINPQVPFWTAELIPALIFWPWIIIYYLGRYQTKIKEEAERIRNSPEYQQQCAAVDQAYQRRVLAAEEQYQAALQQYNEKILPQYEKDFAQWTQEHNAEVAALKAELDGLEQELDAHYEATRVVPVQYRRINALQYIYDCLKSSNYTVAEAINSYEQAIQRQIEAERLEEERRRAEAAERAAEAEERAAWAAEEAAAAAERAQRAAAENSGSNNSGGILSEAKRRAEEKARRKREKSLWGTGMCQYGKKDKDGWTISCPRCPLYHECGGKP